MAIALDAATNGGTSATTTLTYSHTCTGSNLILVVEVMKTDNGDAVTSVTYNGVAMTQAIKQPWNPNTNTWIYLYYLFAPATGANNVVVTCSANSNQVASCSASYTGAAQSGTPDTAFYSGNDASGNYVATVTVSTANSWLVSAYRSADADPTASVNATARIGAPGGNPNIQDSNAGVGSGSQTIGYTWAASDRKIIVALAFAPLASAGGTVKRVMNLPLLGVG